MVVGSGVGGCHRSAAIDDSEYVVHHAKNDARTRPIRRGDRSTQLEVWGSALRAEQQMVGSSSEALCSEHETAAPSTKRLMGIRAAGGKTWFCVVVLGRCTPNVVPGTEPRYAVLSASHLVRGSPGVRSSAGERQLLQNLGSVARVQCPPQFC